jgi:hypothetical protein
MLLRKVGSIVVTALQQQDAANNGPFVNSKGRSNFGKPIGAPNDSITLADSNFLKTIATAGQHPSNDAGDIAIGVPDFVDAAEIARSTFQYSVQQRRVKREKPL